MWAIAAALLVFQAADPASQGLKALDEGKYQEAVQALTQAIAADPQNYFSHFNLALAYGYLRRDAEGVAEYRKTLELRPGLYEAELNAAILLVRDKEPADASPLLEDAAAQKPAEFQPRFFLAQAQLQTGALDRAEESFRRALEINPQSGAAHLGLARTLAREDKLADAAPHFRQASDLDASLRSCLLELADLYERNHQPAEAIAIYRGFPGDAAAQKRVNELLLESNRYAEAASRLEQAYAAEPSQDNRILLAEAYVAARQLDEALPLLAKAVAADGANYDLHMSYGRALRDSRQFPAAAAQFHEAAGLKPGEAVAWSELAASLSLAGDDAQALAAFERAHDLGQDTPGNWFARAIILDKLRRLKPALEAYQHFLSLSQDKFPDQEFQARQRARIIQRELAK